jgi:hypothetical protein
VVSLRRIALLILIILSCPEMHSYYIRHVPLRAYNVHTSRQFNLRILIYCV